MTQKLYIKSYGCQMNVYDAQRMADVMGPAGYDEVATAEEADVIILNTCHIREKAAEKVYSELGRIRKLKAAAAGQGRQVKVAVAGCVAQAEGEEILRRAPVVDVVVGPQSYHRLKDLMAQAAQGRRVVDTEFPVEDKFGHLPPATQERVRQRGVTAFVTVQEGCDKFCTFCVVPYTRGAEFSRPLAAIEQEVRRLVGQGVKEITLLGQNVNAWHGEGPNGQTWTLARLLYHLAEMEGVERLRYMTSHPRDMTPELIEAHGRIPQLMPYLHLPVQAGSDRILAAMNRKHTRDDYLRIIDEVRQVCPDMALSSDFIVGFPGETEQDFRDTMDLVERVEFAGAFSFKYSPRPGTPGADLPDQVPEATKTAHLHELQARLDQQKNDFNARCVGRRTHILLEKSGRLAGQLVGRSPWLQPVQVDAPDTLLGQIIPVYVTHTGTNSLFAEANVAANSTPQK